MREASLMNLPFPLDERKELKTRDVLFGGEITVRAQSTLKAKSSDSMIFDKALLIDGSGKVEIESRNIALKKLNFQQTGGSASFTVLPEEIYEPPFPS